MNLFRLSAISLVLLLYFGSIQAVRRVCNLQTGNGCTSKEPFIFYPMPTPNDTISSCNLNYRVKILPLSQYNSVGFQCTFHFDALEPNGYMYSISEDLSAEWRNEGTPYMYGYGLDANISSRLVTTGSIHNLNWHIGGFHTNTDGSQSSSVIYKITDNRFLITSTSEDRIDDGSLAMFQPTVKTTWIGINGQALDSKTDGQGSGICRAECKNF